jgi:hypothetical protein
MIETFVKELTHIDRNILDCGWGCGYALIPPEHELHGKHYDDIEGIDVHGGLTFADIVDEPLMSHFGVDPKFEGYWMVGFDTAHAGDNLEKWPEVAVRAEAARLASQL